MMITSQMKALIEAQPQPSASSSPNRARLRGTHHARPKRGPGRALDAHPAVSVPVMLG